MPTPRIGVVVPTWNSAKFLDFTLLSLRKQEGCEVEIVAADSGSTDGTLDICKRWDVPTIYEPPGSMYRAVNAGMAKLTSPWVGYINSDDVMYSDGYVRLLELGESSSADVSYGDADYIDEAGRFLFPYRCAKPELLTKLCFKGIMAHSQPGTIFRREVFDSVGPFRPDFRHISDGQFFRAAVKAGRKFVYLGTPAVCAFRMLQSQLHQKEADVVAKERAILIAEGEFDPSGITRHWLEKRIQLANLPNYFVRLLRKRTIRMH